MTDKNRARAQRAKAKQQSEKQSWVFEAKAEQDAAAIAAAEEAAKPPSVTHNFAYPHKYMWAMRGVPMMDLGGDGSIQLPPMNLPVEAQHSEACHLELCGFIHVSELYELAVDGQISVLDLPEQKIKHRKPTHGPDIPINPGTWVDINAPDEAEEPEVIPPVDLTGVPDAAIEALREGIRLEDERKAKAAQVDATQRSQEDMIAEAISPDASEPVTLVPSSKNPAPSEGAPE